MCFVLQRQLSCNIQLTVIGSGFFSEFFIAFERNLSDYAQKCGCLKTNTNMLPIVSPTQGFSQCLLFLVRNILGHLWYLKLKRISSEEQMQHLHFPVWVFELNVTHCYFVSPLATLYTLAAATESALCF